MDQEDCNGYQESAPLTSLQEDADASNLGPHTREKFGLDQYFLSHESIKQFPSPSI